MTYARTLPGHLKRTFIHDRQGFFLYSSMSIPRVGVGYGPPFLAIIVEHLWVSQSAAGKNKTVLPLLSKSHTRPPSLLFPSPFALRRVERLSVRIKGPFFAALAATFGFFVRGSGMK